MSVGLADRLVVATSSDRVESGVVVEAEYQPVGGRGGRIMPPTYPADAAGGSPYLTFDRLVDGGVQSVVVVDQVPSQANRVEEAFAEAWADGRLRLPLFSLTVKTPVGGQRLTSLDFPHRFADAYLRDSLVEGIRFDKSAPGQALRGASLRDASALFAREPYSLLFGAWDSHRKGVQAKFPRLYSSEMLGVDWQEAARRAGRIDPMNLSGAIDDKAKAEKDWRYLAPGVEAKKEKGKKLSEIGHGHIAPNAAPGGGTVSQIQRRAWISTAGLARLRFGDASAEAAGLARATLLALALVGDRLTFGGPSVWLRSGCDLTKVSESIGFEKAGGEVEPLTVSAAQALEAFEQLRKRTADAGLVMADDVIELEPTPQLGEAIAYAVTRSEGAED